MNAELLALAERLSKFLAVLESARRCENKAISVWSDDVEIVSKSVDALRLAAQSLEPVAWRAVPGFEGYYEASSDGRIRSVSSGHELSTSSLAGSGYVKADLWKANARKQTYLHRVIAETFLEPPTDDRTEINHIDGNKRNNAASNLEWSSRSENVRHSMYSLGNNVKPVVATDPDTLQEERYRSIEEAGRLGYCAASIYKCLTGKRDRHAGKTWRFDSAPPQSASDGALREALEEIESLGCHLRQGGPDPIDLQELSDALEEATSLASEALAASEATKSDGGVEGHAAACAQPRGVEPEVAPGPSDPIDDGVLTPNVTTIAAIEELKRGDGEVGTGYGDYIPITTGASSVPSDTRPADVTVEEALAEDTSIGGITWHSSEEDGGPDVGISVYLGPDDRLWCGEISRRLFDEHDGPTRFDNDMGAFIVRFTGKETTLIAKCADHDVGREFIEQFASLARMAALLDTYKIGAK